MVAKAKRQKLETAVAYEGLKGFDMIPEFCPDLILLDIGLPDSSGLEVLDLIMENNPHAYVVMLSGNDDIINISKTLEAGAQGFVAKPFKKEKLLHYINEYTTAAV